MKILLPTIELAYIQERCALLGFKNLHEYHRSELFQKNRADYISRHEYICAAKNCGRRRKLRYHHCSYQNMGAELDSDVRLLCGYHHSAFHLFWNRLIEAGKL